MDKSSKPSLPRLREILRRQDPVKWGADYEPAIMATREEAPRESRPSKISLPRWGREFHLLSLPEAAAAMLALHHPRLLELQEQRILHTEAIVHPLVGHPAATGMALPHLRGTIDVAMRLGFLNLHPIVYLVDEECVKRPVAFPYVGDLLLFMQDEHGAYCVNWTIKHSSDQFEKRSHRQRPSRKPQDDELAAKARHAIEEVYYLDAGIRTIRITKDDIPDALRDNLRELVLWQTRPMVEDAELVRMVIDRMQGCVLTRTPPLGTMLMVQNRHGITIYDQKVILYRAIWNRELRVDLFGAPLYIDLPLPPQKIDVTKYFADWFSRESV